MQLQKCQALPSAIPETIYRHPRLIIMRSNLFIIILSSLLVSTYFVTGHLFLKDQNHSEWGYFFLYLTGGVYSISIGVVSLIKAILSKHYSINYLTATSCFANFAVSYVPYTWMMNKYENVNFIMLITFSLAPLLFIIQCILLIKSIRNINYA